MNDLQKGEMIICVNSPNDELLLGGTYIFDHYERSLGEEFIYLDRDDGRAKGGWNTWRFKRLPRKKIGDVLSEFKYG